MEGGSNGGLVEHSCVFTCTWCEHRHAGPQASRMGTHTHTHTSRHAHVLLPPPSPPPPTGGRETWLTQCWLVMAWMTWSTSPACTAPCSTACWWSGWGRSRRFLREWACAVVTTVWGGVEELVVWGVECDGGVGEVGGRYRLTPLARISPAMLASQHMPPDGMWPLHDPTCAVSPCMDCMYGFICL